MAADLPSNSSAYEGRSRSETRLSPDAPAIDAASVSSLAEVARGGTLNLAGAAFSAVITLALTVLVTRNFSKPVAGAFFTATSLYLIAEAIANLGAYNGVIYFIGRLRSAGGEAKIPAVLHYAYLPVLVASLGAATALLFFAAPFARALLDAQPHGGADVTLVATALRALAVTVPFAALADTFLGASRGYRDMRPTVFVDRVGRSTLQLLGMVAAVAAGSAALLAPLWALPYVPAGLAAWFWLSRVRRKPRPSALTPSSVANALLPSGDRGAGRQAPDSKRLTDVSWRTFWRFTAPRSLATVAQILIQRLDIVLVAVMRGPIEAAIYAAATRFLVVGQLGNSAISMAAQPQFTHLFAIRDRRSANTVYQATTAWLILLTWPLYFLAIIFGPQILAIFGHSYRAGSHVMVILGLAMLVATACGQVDMVLITAGRSSWSLANGLLAVGVNVGVDVALIPHYGITGAAIGWAAAIAVTNLVPLAQVAFAVKVHPFGAGSLTACLLTTLSFCAIPLAGRAIAGAGPVAGTMAIVTGLAVMGVGLWRFRNILHLVAIPGARQMRSVARIHPPNARSRPAGAHRK